MVQMFETAGCAPGFLASPQTRGVPALCRGRRPLNSTPRTTGAVNRSFQATIADDHPGATVEAPVERVFQRLFRAYDRDGNDNVDVEEFTKAEAVLAQVFSTPHSKESCLAEFFAVSSAGGGEISYDTFVDWQMQRFPGAFLEQELAVLARCADELERVWAEEEAKTCYSPVASPAGAGARAAEALSRGRQTVNGGGGRATYSQGFIESVNVESDVEAFEAALKVEEDSSDEEARRLKEVMKGAGVQNEIRRLTRELRTLRRQCALPEELSAKADLLQKLLQQHRSKLSGRVQIRGTVNSRKKQLRGATVKLFHQRSLLTAVPTNRKGAFEITSRSGVHVLIAEKEGFAPAVKRIGCDGLHHLRLEMAPLTFRASFLAVPGSQSTELCDDPVSRAIIEVPVGELLKGGRPFAGKVNLQMAIIDVPSCLESAPQPVGQALDGAQTKLSCLGLVYLILQDAGDGSRLTLDARSSGIEVAIPSTTALTDLQPSVWHYSDAKGEWVQTLQSVAVNGSHELPTLALKAASERKPERLQEDRLRDAQHLIEMRLQEGRSELDAQREAESQPKICTCGWRSKQYCLPRLQQEQALASTDPPKRIFAGTEVEGGRRHFQFPYITSADQSAAVSRAALLPEVHLSHHLAIAARILGRPWCTLSSRLHPSSFYLAEARKALPSLRHIASWLVKSAVLLASLVPVPTEDVPLGVLELKVLEKLTGLWIQPSHSTLRLTLLELHDSLQSAGDVAEALLAVCYSRAQREEAREVQKILSAKDPALFARYATLHRALGVEQGDAHQAAQRVSAEGEVKALKQLIQVRQALSSKLPNAYASRREVREAMASAGDVMQAAEALAQEDSVRECTFPFIDWHSRRNLRACAHVFQFQLLRFGWNAVAAPEALDRRISPTGVTEEHLLEFYPRLRPPLRAGCDSSLVMGVFEDSVRAVCAVAVSLEHGGLHSSEQVQPDGAFFVFVLGNTRFRIKTFREDGSESFSFGPYVAAAPGQVAHLGLLVPNKDLGIGATNPSLADAIVAPMVDVLLPALEFPPFNVAFPLWCGRWTFVRGPREPPLDVEKLVEQGRIPVLTRAFDLEEWYDDTNQAVLTLCFGGETWMSAGKPSDDGSGERIEFAERGQTVRLWKDKGCLSSEAWFQLALDGSSKFGRSVKVKQTHRGGERCTCFDKEEAEEEELASKQSSQACEGVE